MSDAPKFDLATSEGGRGYLAHLFRTHLKRHDFTQYIGTDLAADFACVMSRFVHRLLTNQADMQKRLDAAFERQEPVAYRWRHPANPIYADRKVWEPITLALGVVYLERKARAIANNQRYPEDEYYFALEIEPLFASPETGASE